MATLKACMFLLPKTTVRDIDRVLKGFLWYGGELQKGKAKLKWVHMVKLKGRGIWDVQQDSNDSWSWKALMDIRDRIRPHIINKIRNGKQVSMWYDNWSDIGPLDQYISIRDIYDARFFSYANVINNGRWKWPEEWLQQFLLLQQILVPALQHNSKYYTIWRSNDGSLKKFLTKQVWHDCIVQLPTMP
ncbi:hypothetical protein Tco_1391089 [Tanacetum coccineum]